MKRPVTIQIVVCVLYHYCSILKYILHVQLNNVEVGGATVFPKLNLAARPVKVYTLLLHCKENAYPEKHSLVGNLIGLITYLLSYFISVFNI